MSWAPRASIERTDRMLVFMDPVSLVVECQQELSFSPLLQWLVRERSWVRTRRSLSWDEGCVGSPSSREQWTCSNLLTAMQKVAICEPHEIRIVLSVGSVWCVGQVFPYRVYIDSNRCDSQI
jgi:hypothetical protein